MTFKHKITGIQAKLAEDGKYYIHNCSIGIPKQFIEDSKVWLKEDGYEILSFKSSRLDFYMPNVQKDGTYLDNPIMSCDGGGAPLDWMLKESEYYIYSIKRLNDGEVFTVGDKVRFSKDYNAFTIEKITLKGDRLELEGDGLFCSVIESNVYKVVSSLFTTQEGDDIFEGDSYWCVNTAPHLWTMWEQMAGKNTKLNKGVLAFTYEISAKKFIKENKPQYSLNDIRDILIKEMEYTPWVMINVDKIIEDLENGER